MALFTFIMFSLRMYSVISTNIHLETATPEDNRDECGVRDPNRDTDCPEGSICLLDGVLNRCVRSKFLRILCMHDQPNSLSQLCSLP